MIFKLIYSDTVHRLGRGRGVSDEQSEQLRKDLEAEQVAAKEVKEKARTDALWASFLSDVGPKAKAPEKKVLAILLCSQVFVL